MNDMHLNRAHSQNASPTQPALSLAQRRALATLANEKLFIAIRRDSDKLIDLALDSGADINCKNNAGVTPLILAVDLQSPTMLKSLMDRGAKLDLKEPGRGTALEHAQLHVDQSQFNPRMLAEATHLLNMIKAEIESRELFKSCRSLANTPDTADRKSIRL